MTINYTEKGAGLHAAIRAAGHWLEQRDGVWISSDDAAVQTLIDGYTLARAIAERQRECAMHAKAVRDAVVAHISAGEMASWPIKRAEAAAYAVSGDPADAPMLAAEAQVRGITLQAMMDKVAANAQAFLAIEAAISGVDGKHRDALAGLQTWGDVLSYDLNAGWPVF